MPSSLDHVERDVEADEERHGGREGAVALGLGLGVLAPVEVVAAARIVGGVFERALGDGGEAEAGRAHQRLLGPGDDDVDPPLVLAQLGRAEARDGVDGEDRVVRAGDLGDRGDVVHDAGRGLAQRGEDDLDAVVLAQEAVDLGGVEALAPAGLVADGLRAERVGELDPALAELAGGAGEHGGAGRTRLAAADSMPPDPLAAKASTGFSVWKTWAASPAPARRARRTPGRGGRASARPSPATPQAERASARRSSGTA